MMKGRKGTQVQSRITLEPSACVLRNDEVFVWSSTKERERERKMERERKREREKTFSVQAETEAVTIVIGVAECIK